MKVFRFALISFVLSCCLSSFAAAPCEERRGAMDFGSGTTKAFAAVVDVCQKKIVEVLLDERMPLALNEALEKSPAQEIPSEIIDSAIPHFKRFLLKMKELNVSSVKAVATSVFRVAKNGAVTAKRISAALQIPVEVISQEKEAELGYWSALAQKNIPAGEKVIVWDIGGGSMQMYARWKDKVHVYQGNLASVTFKNEILHVLQFKDPKKVSSPNPFARQREAAVQLAKNHAYLNVPSFFKEHAKEGRWLGVGGVLSLSVQRQVKKTASEFNSEELAETLKARSALTDAQIESDYRVTDISNLALVLGYMQALGIPQVETVQASLGQGLIYSGLQKR